jgi:hypothetical protein
MPLNFSIDKAATIVGSQRKLAEALGISNGNLYEMKAGKRACPLGLRRQIALLAGHDPIKAIFEGLATKLDPTDEYEAQVLTAINLWANAIPDEGEPTAAQEKTPATKKASRSNKKL